MALADLWCIVGTFEPPVTLTPKQQAFAREYVKTGHVINSYRVAYPNSKGTDKTVSVNAARLLTNTRVALEIERIRLAVATRCEITIDRVMREYAKLAFCDIRKAFDKTGNLKALVDMDDETAGAIASVETEETYAWEGEGEARKRVSIGRTAKLKLWDKRAALDSLAKTLGMFQEAAPSTGGGTVFQLVLMQAGHTVDSPEVRTVDIRALIKE